MDAGFDEEWDRCLDAAGAPDGEADCGADRGAGFDTAFGGGLAGAFGAGFTSFVAAAALAATALAATALAGAGDLALGAVFGFVPGALLGALTAGKLNRPTGLTRGGWPLSEPAKRFFGLAELVLTIVMG